MILEYGIWHSSSGQGNRLTDITPHCVYPMLRYSHLSALVTVFVRIRLHLHHDVKALCHIKSIGHVGFSRKCSHNQDPASQYFNACPVLLLPLKLGRFAKGAGKPCAIDCFPGRLCCKTFQTCTSRRQSSEWESIREALLALQEPEKLFPQLPMQWCMSEIFCNTEA